MDLDRYKSAWQNRAVAEPPLAAQVNLSTHLRFLRTSSIRDLQRSDEWARLIFSLLFALIAGGASTVVMRPGGARIAAWLFALALLADGATGMVLLMRRLRAPATTSMVEFISREYRQVESRLRIERYSQRFMVLLAAAALLLVMVFPSPADSRENAMESLERMAVVTAFLAVAWRRTRNRLVEISHELERYMKDLEGQGALR
jgi:hypothetical protein